MEATMRMGPQVVTHVLIVLLVLLGNVTYFISRRRPTEVNRKPDMDVTLQLWIDAALTLMILSFLYRDNPFYKFAEHLFVGVSAAYLMAIGFWDHLVPNLLGKLFPSLMAGVVPSAADGLRTTTTSSPPSSACCS